MRKVEREVGRLNKGGVEFKGGSLKQAGRGKVGGEGEETRGPEDR